ncbi:hypothetical protein SAMN05192561_1065 [Halopenitus malekzadehii]|uniref:DNA-3-methyladenine glycosylase 2 family protein n=1 Tax=Halopenitus malekzadehii TaxID=1267564 RepID=A0A1H6J3C9_9EURY|nr:hypothetical protein [Halopenitus malekzadehii]SEH54734.1 hypothetical protein SAMN05192561_1065 [Halopenitus malekzadehii]
MTNAATDPDLTADTIAELSAAYRETEPIYAVEQEQRETLPEAFRAGEFGRRDAEWVVRWYFRRHLGAYPDRDRRAVEERFESNPFDDVIAAITTAADRIEEEDVAGAVTELTALEGVDVGVASAFLAFLDPESYPVVSEREWRALRECGTIAEPYPDLLGVDDYRRYRSACLEIAGETGHDLPAITHALWRHGADGGGGQDRDD